MFNVFILLVGDPGVGKSKVQEKIFSLLKKHGLEPKNTVVTDLKKNKFQHIVNMLLR